MLLFMVTYAEDRLPELAVDQIYYSPARNSFFFYLRLQINVYPRAGYYAVRIGWHSSKAGDVKQHFQRNVIES